MIKKFGLHIKELIRMLWVIFCIVKNFFLNQIYTQQILNRNVELLGKDHYLLIIVFFSQPGLAQIPKEYFMIYNQI